jgi:hypothetical protein
MQWAALISWILTAAGGSLLFLQWWRHGGPSQQEGIRTIRLAAHAGTAVLGLILWIAFVVTDTQALAWLAVALLVVVALVGFSMLLISSRGKTTHVRTEAPAEGMFPLPLVAGHGILAVTTFTLTLLAAAGIGT